MQAPRIKRKIDAEVIETLAGFRIAVLNGPRQCGKTTLAKAIALELGGNFWSLDDPAVLSAALNDPKSLISNDGQLTVIDEVQRAGDPLLLSIKQAVDQSDRRGQFLLTGSANFLTVPTLSETLAGRVGLLEMGPFAQAELRPSSNTTSTSFPRALFGETESLRSFTTENLSKSDYFQLAVVGGFPEVQTLTPRMRTRWFESYVQTLTQREIQNVADVRQLDELIHLLNLTATNTAQEFNVSRAADIVRLTRDTVRTYRSLLEMVYVVSRLPPWSRNISKRVARKEKLFVADSGLAAAVVGVDLATLMKPTSTYAGALMETFVVSEIRKLKAWSHLDFNMFHMRNDGGREVDIVLETKAGAVAGIEVKAAQSVSFSDFRGLELLRNELGEEFINGVVLYSGDTVLGFGDRMTAMPISSLWA